jgi:hypothetical protein
VGNWAVIHNGIWSEYNVVKLALEKGLGTKFQGETDSEVAAHLFNLAGPLKFSQEIDRGGVFIALNRNGELHAVKTSGDLAIVTLPKRRVLLSSEFDFQTYPRSIEAVLGWYHFDKHGCFIKAKGKKFETPASWGYSQYPSNGISAYTTYVPSFVPQSILTGKRNEEISKRPLSFHDRDWTDDAGSMYD